MRSPVLNEQHSDPALKVHLLSPEADIFAKKSPYDYPGDDERVRKTDTLKLQHPVEIEIKRPNGVVEIKKVTEGLQRYLNYKTETQDLTTEGKVVSILQEIVNKMAASEVASPWRERVAKYGITAPRVVLEKKGITPSGAITADGSIFLSISLINQMCQDLPESPANLDTIVHILAHEFNHVINDTRGAIERNPRMSMTIKNLHEGAADVTRKLVESAGFNPLHAGRALEYLTAQKNIRSEIHQSTLTRTSQGIGELHLYDSAKAGQEPTPIPPEFLELPEPLPTNAELINFSLEKRDTAKILDLLPKLHPQDLLHLRQNVSSYFEDSSQKHHTFFILIDAEIKKRAQDNITHIVKDKTEDITSLVLTQILSETSQRRMLYLFDNNANSVLMTLRLLHSLNKDYSSAPLIKALSRETFDSSEKTSFYSNFVDQVISGIYPEEAAPKELGVKVSEDQFKELALFLHKFNEGTHNVFECVFQYCVQRFSEKGKIKDVDQLTQFLTQLKTSGVQFTKLEILTIKNDQFNSSGYEFASRRDHLELMELIKKNLLSDERGEELSTKLMFENLNDLTHDLNNKQLFIKLKDLLPKLLMLSTEIDQASLTEHEKRVAWKQAAEKIDAASIDTVQIKAKDFLGGDTKIYSEKEVLEQTSKEATNLADDLDKFLFRFHLKLIHALYIFEHDTDEFYSVIEEQLNEARPHFQTLSSIQKANFLAPIVELIDKYKDENRENSFTKINLQWYTTSVEHAVALPKTTIISQPERLLGHPMILETLQSLDVSWDVRSWQELTIRTDAFFDRLHTYHTAGKKPGYIEDYGSVRSNSIYGNEVYKMLFTLPIRNSAEKLLQQPLKKEDIPFLQKYIEFYFPQSVTRENILRSTHRMYLEDSTITVDDKLEYIYANIDQVDYDLIEATVASIDTLSTTYAQFRAKMGSKFDDLLRNGPSKKYELAGEADFITSQLIESYSIDKLLRTMDESLAKEISTEIAQAWIKAVFTSYSSYGKNKIDPSTGKIILDVSQFHGTFTSLKDTFQKIKLASSFHKAAVVAKLLTEERGILSDEEKRRRFGSMMVQGLELPDGFITDTFMAGIRKIEARFLTFPITQTLAPHLYKAIDFSKIDLEALQDTIILTDGSQLVKFSELAPKDFDWKRFFNASTEEIANYGGKLSSHPEERIRHHAHQSIRQYSQSIEKLHEVLPKPKANETENTENQNVRGHEAALKGIQTAGALPIRGMQIYSQVATPEDPEVARVYSKALDKNPGMDAIWFRENLYAHAENYPELKKFILEHDLRIGKKIAAGSLFSTYEGTIILNGEKVEVVIQQLNANAHMFVEEYFKQIETVFSDMIKNDPKNAQAAQLAIDNLKVAREWCRKNIVDLGFEEGLRLFNNLLSEFNTEFGEHFSTPELFFIQRAENEKGLYAGRTLVKIMKKVPGRTIKDMVEDLSVPQELKLKAVRRMSKIHEYQLSHPLELNGELTHIIHSDPHIANALIDESDPNLPINIIDLDMMSRARPDQAKTFYLLLKQKGPLDVLRALNNLLDDVLDQQKERGISKRWAKKFRTIRSIRKMLSRTSQDNPLQVVQALNQALKVLGYDLPVEYHLLLKGVAEKREQERRYGMKK